MHWLCSEQKDSFLFEPSLSNNGHGIHRQSTEISLLDGEFQGWQAQRSGRCRARRGLNLWTGNKRGWEALETTIWNQARKEEGASKGKIPTHCSPPGSRHFNKIENTLLRSPTSFLHSVYSSEKWTAWVVGQWFLTFLSFNPRNDSIKNLILSWNTNSTCITNKTI